MRHSRGLHGEGLMGPTVVVKADPVGNSLRGVPPLSARSVSASPSHRNQKFDRRPHTFLRLLIRLYEAVLFVGASTFSCLFTQSACTKTSLSLILNKCVIIAINSQITCAIFVLFPR